MEYYYLNASGTPVGPMPWSAIRSLKEARVISNETLVAMEGSDEWTPYITLIVRGESAIAAPTVSAASNADAPEQATAPVGAGMPFPAPAPVTVPIGTAESGPALQAGGSRSRHLLLFGIFGVLVLLLIGTGGLAALLYFRGSPAAEASVLAGNGSDSASRGKRVPNLDPHETRHPHAAGAEEASASPAATPLASRNPSAGGGKVETPKSAPVIEASPVPPKVAPSNYRDPLAEWYDFGYRQGRSVLRVHEAFGRAPVATRSQLYQLLKNLDVEPAALKPEAVETCMRGYSDGVSGLETVMTVPEGAITSILPQELRGYHTYKGGPTLGEETGDFASRARAASVMILALGRSSKEHSQGSGFFIAPGIIVTNRHVVDKGTKLMVIMPDKTEVTAKLVGKSTTIDAAVLKVDRMNHSTLRFARSSTVQIGAQVCAVGYPVSDYLAAASGTADFSKALAGISPTSTYGRVGGRQMLKNTKCLHLDLNLNPGNSGGPVVDRASQVVGVSTYKLMGADGTVQGMNFAIEADLVRQFVEDTVPGIRL